MASVRVNREHLSISDLANDLRPIGRKPRSLRKSKRQLTASCEFTETSAIRVLDEKGRLRIGTRIIGINLRLFPNKEELTAVKRDVSGEIHTTGCRVWVAR